ncbi:hypothetical protein D3C84_495850 [compost metagenome]
MPVVRVQRLSPASVYELLRAHGQYLLWCAFHIDRGMSIMVVMQCRHEAVFSIKRNGVGAGPGLMIFFSIDSGLCGKCQQGTLHRIALYLP